LDIIAYIIIVLAVTYVVFRIIKIMRGKSSCDCTDTEQCAKDISACASCPLKENCARDRKNTL